MQAGKLDIFGANRSALDSSEATARASAAGLGDVQVSIAAEVALAYIALRGAQRQLAIANDNLASQRETLQITLWRLQAGLVTSIEAEQARTAVEQTGALLPALQTSIDQTCHALAVLTGQPPAALLTQLAAAGPVPQAADDLALSIPAETLRQRPDVRAAEHQVTAAVGRVRQAEAARLPNFRLGGSLGLNALSLGSLTDGASVVSALLADAFMPIFDGGGRSAQVRAEQAALDQALAAYQAAVLTALQDVEDALVALRGDRERLLRLENAAEAAGNAALLARQRYSSGLVDFQTVLDTQRSQLATQDSVANARADVSADHVRLYKALGGGWLPDDSEEPSDPDRKHPQESPFMSPANPSPAAATPPEAGSEADLAALLAEPVAAPLVPPTGAVGRRRAGPAGDSRPVVLAGTPDRRCGADLHHADRGARRPDPDRHRQRHAAADPLDQHRQRTLGHGAEGQRRRQRPGQEGPGAGRARYRQAARPDPALARRAGRRQRQGRPDRRDGEGGQGHPGAVRRSGASVGRQGAVQDRARQQPRDARTGNGRRGQRPRRRRRRAGGACPPTRSTCPRRRSARRPTAWC